MKGKYKSEAVEAIHTTIEAMHRAGTVDKATMLRFDESCLDAPETIAPAEIKKIRKSAQKPA